MRQPRRIVVIGPEGSGKGTQVALLVRRFRLPAVSTGDLLRAKMKEPSRLGREIARRMNRGKYLPTEMVNQLLVGWLRQKGKRGFILDGYPRKLDQVRTLDRLVTLDAAVVLDLPDRIAVARLSGRRVSSCGRIYHLKYNPPPRGLRCAVCGDRLTQRDDDRPAQVRGRLRAYHRYTDPVITAYDRRGLSRHVDARPAIAVIARQIVKAFSTGARGR